MIKVILNGALGKMGKTVLRAAFSSQDCEVVAAVEDPAHPYINKKITEAVPESELNIIVTSDHLQAMSRGDVIIDFSNTKTTLECLESALKKQLPVIIGATGFSKADFAEIKKYSKSIPVVLTSNMSVGVNILASLLGKTAPVLKDDFDVEILEMHHNQKVDSPSGTALYFASSIASSMNKKLSDVLITDRKGKRPKGKIGMSVMRGGDVAGEHTVMFLGDGERIEFTHRVSDRIVFARGALRAAKWVIGKEPGLYSMLDILNIK